MAVLLAVSGGIDSMYLAETSFRQNLSFAVAHCNFHLRGEESDADEAFVRDWCSSHDIRCFVKGFDTKACAEGKSISIEMAARELRYRWFAELCLSEGFTSVTVAHNANDNAETLMLNLLRGTGSKGLRGMGRKSVQEIDGVGALIIERPLLGTTRAEIYDWMVSNGCLWREDRTNGETEYKRNRIRLEAFPVFADINPSFVRTLNEDMARFTQVDEIAEDYFLESRTAVLSTEGRININALLSRKHWKYLLYRLTEGHINASELESLYSSLESGRPMAGKQFGEYFCTNRQIILSSGTGYTQAGPAVDIIDREELTCLKQPEGILVMDAGKFHGSPLIRPWRNGDWMVPLGMRGRKKISDLMVDLKYTLEDKASACVVEHPDSVPSHVAALLYERIDDTVKVTGSTRKVLKIKKAD